MGHFSVCSISLISVLFLLNIQDSFQMTLEELENHVNPEDLRRFMNMVSYDNTTKEKEDLILYAAPVGTTTNNPVPDMVDCFGPYTRQIGIFFNMEPKSSDAINTHFYFISRSMANRVQVFPGKKFSLKSVDFKPKRKTVMIIHGFLSYSAADWVHAMARAFLKWDDVNVIAVDWSGGGNTFNYFRAVANTRRVGSDIVGFMHQMITTTGVKTKDLHLVGHSLGAHIAAYASYRLGKVARITGLDPAQPCFKTTEPTERLDATDADYVDIIHTNGRLLSKIGFGLPERIGHADFYPNGGMKQPGCKSDTDCWLSKLNPLTKLYQAICNHGRSYVLFTESLLNKDCTFKGRKWDLTYEGVNASLKVDCAKAGSCTEMGIGAIGTSKMPSAKGSYFVLTTDKEPYCPTDWERLHPQPELLSDLQNGFLLDESLQKPTCKAPVMASDANPKVKVREAITQTTPSSWFPKIIG